MELWYYQIEKTGSVTKTILLISDSIWSGNFGEVWKVEYRGLICALKVPKDPRQPSEDVLIEMMALKYLFLIKLLFDDSC